MNRTREMAFLALLAAVLACRGQSTIHFKSGAKHEGEILAFENGIFTVRLANGVRAQTRQENIYKIEFASPRTKAIPPEFDVVAPAGSASAASGASSESIAPARVAPLPEPAARSAPERSLTLGSHWQMRLGRGNISHKDTARILSNCGTPQIDLEGKAIDLWGEIEYLMPLNDARQALGLGTSKKSSVTSSVFPPNSLFQHEFPGNFEDGFTRLYLVTDTADQIVAIQLQDNSSREERWFPDVGNNYSTEWSLFNFLGDGKKANPNWQIGFHVCQGSKRVFGYPPRANAYNPAGLGPTGVNEGVVRVDSDLYSMTRDRWNMVTDAKSRQRVRIYLPQPLVDLMLYVSQQVR
jgi:hypothetical protein